MPDPKIALSTLMVERRSSVATRPGTPSSRLTCSVGRDTTVSAGARARAAPARWRDGRRGRRSTERSQPWRVSAACEFDDERVVVDGARDRDDEVLRPVVRAVVLQHGLAGGGADGLGAAADRAAERMLPQHGLEEALVRDVRRVVARHRELLEDDAALVVELDGVEERRGEHVGEHLDRHGQVAVLHLGVVAGVLLGGERVVLAADGVEGDGDVERGAAASCP